ncbi:MAG: hypothetical protein AAF843_01075 [Bacteroidota bacterium]
MATKYVGLNRLLKLLILIFCIVFLWLKLDASHRNLFLLFQQFENSVITSYQLTLFILVLMPINWSIEAWKWKLLTNRVSVLNFQDALKGVVVGLGLGSFTPYGIGDYFGRIGLMLNSDRKRLLGPLLLGRMLQLLVTLLFGIYGVGYFFGVTYLAYTCAIIMCAVIFFLILRGILQVNFHSGLSKRLKVYFGLIQDFTPNEIVRVFCISFLRYLVFGFQFFLALHIFLSQTNTQLKMAGITWVFLAKSIIPTFNFLSDLGVREVSAVFFYEKFSIEAEPVILASLLVWLINLLLPIVISWPLIFKLRLIR